MEPIHNQPEVTEEEEEAFRELDRKLKEKHVCNTDQRQSHAPEQSGINQT